MSKPTEVELTSKKWKLQILLSALCAIFGMIFVGLGLGAEVQSLAGLGGFMTVGGVVWFIFARIMAWWNHG